MSHEGAHGSVGIDLSQFFQVFFDEAGENLQLLEQMLLALDVCAADDETLNAIFRCAHSVKGGAATFGFADVAALTHQMEALLDKLRRHELLPTAQMVDLLLAAGDALKALLARHQGSTGQAPDSTGLQQAMQALCAGGVARLAAPAIVASTAPALPPTDAQRVLALTVSAQDDPSAADSLAELFNEIAGLGRIEPLHTGHAADGVRRFRITTTSSDSDLLDLFTFHLPRDALRLAPIGPGDGLPGGTPGAAAQHAAASAGRDNPADGYGFFTDAPGAPQPLAAVPGQPVGRAPPARPRRAPTPGQPPPPTQPRCGCRSRK